MAMNARLVGSGKVTLVLAHGYGGSQSVWDAVVPELSQRYQLLLFDWSFSGAISPPAAFDSPEHCSFEFFADVLISLLLRFGLKGVVFVGHSMSGMIGCAAYIKKPELFRHLVLVASSPRYINSDKYDGGFDLCNIESIINNIESNFHAWVEDFGKAVMATEDPHALQNYLQSFKGMNPKTALALAKTIFYSDQRHLLQHVWLPCTIVQGTQDIAVSVAVGRYMQSKIKGKTSVEIVEGSGHFPQLTCKEKFIEIINRTLMPYM
ncbi:hypothetical protein HPP92_007678 [Vanilla planifolia]|uniref:AB hydrolase-1 domain-containing protein n=1 Tax=Vanilla planifolia TaxID=51239 RepID=A0A835RMW6_VANPL|nr:hypothetical protein HPP92_007678 [Vanilla planifolia]